LEVGAVIWIFTGIRDRRVGDRDLAPTHKPLRKKGPDVEDRLFGRRTLW
jgi:hypothetical protein